MDARRELAHGCSVGWLLFSRRPSRALPLVIAVSVTFAAALAPAPGEAEAGPCPKGMVSIRDKFCIDRFEAATDEIGAPRKGKKSPKVIGPHSPFEPVEGVHVMAVSEKGRVPQGYISRDAAAEACLNAGKRLCTDDEWIEACKGKSPTLYPYGDEHVEGRCNDKGISSFNLLFGPGNNEPPDASAYTTENMNDPRLNKMKGTVAKTGQFSKCTNSFKVFDMVGNLHEWTADPKGTFRGGFYLDTHINGKGCEYRTGAHNGKYHDYSTGFRCCFGGEEQKKTDRMLADRGKSNAKSRSKKDDKKQGAKASGKKKDATKQP